MDLTSESNNDVVFSVDDIPTTENETIRIEPDEMSIEEEDLEEDLDVDINWIDQEEKKIGMNYGFIREPMKKIRIIYAYMGNTAINKVDIQEYELPIQDIDPETDRHPPQIITNREWLQMVETRKNMGDRRYKLADVLLFNVTLDSDEVQSYISGETAENPKFIKNISITSDIVIEPSMFIFHTTNVIYIMLKEIEQPKWLKNSITNKLKPILKRNDREHRRTKKRVHIDLDSNVTI